MLVVLRKKLHLFLQFANFNVGLRLPVLLELTQAHLLNLQLQLSVAVFELFDFLEKHADFRLPLGQQCVQIRAFLMLQTYTVLATYAIICCELRAEHRRTRIPGLPRVLSLGLQKQLQIRREIGG